MTRDMDELIDRLLRYGWSIWEIVGWTDDYVIELYDSYLLIPDLDESDFEEAI